MHSILSKILRIYFGHPVKVCSIFYLYLDTKHHVRNQKRLGQYTLRNIKVSILLMKES